MSVYGAFYLWLQHSQSSGLSGCSRACACKIRVQWSDLVVVFLGSGGGLGMMLRKACRAAQKDQCRDQPMPECRSTSFFSLPGLLVGFAKGMAESDSVRSPTSPLDYRFFSSFGSHLLRSPRSPGAADAPRKSWDCDRVGLGLVDSLSDGADSCRSVLLGSPESRTILLGSQTRINITSAKTRLDRLLAEGSASATSPKSLPKNYVISSHTRVESPCFKPGSSEKGVGIPVAPSELGGLGKIQSCCSSRVGRSPSSSSEVLHSESKNALLISSPFVGGTKFETSTGSLPNARGFMASLSASDIEQSEDYTCIISRGSNPRTTRIFGDCILESCSGDASGFTGDHQGEEERGCLWTVKCSENPMSFPDEDFLRVCFSCKKQLEGKDIYMYRGEKAFCSCSCRSQEILLEEDMEEPAIDSSGSAGTSCYEEIFLPGVAIAT